MMASGRDIGAAEDLPAAVLPPPEAPAEQPAA
jgi:hypothetical protein